MKDWIQKIIIKQMLKTPSAYLLRAVDGKKTWIAVGLFILSHLILLFPDSTIASAILEIIASANVDVSIVRESIYGLFIIGLFDKLRKWLEEDGIIKE